MGVYRPGDEPATMKAEQHTVFSTVLRYYPQRRTSSSLHLDVVHTTGLLGMVTPVVHQYAVLIERCLRV